MTPILSITAHPPGLPFGYHWNGRSFVAWAWRFELWIEHFMRRRR